MTDDATPIERRPLARTCRRRLTTLWLIGGGLILFILFVQTLNDRYTGSSKIVWDWFLPYIVPNLSLMVGVLVANNLKETGTTADGKDEAPKTADPFLFRLSLGLSAVYLVSLTTVLLLWDPNGRPINVYLEDAGLFVTAINGLVGLVLGAFFVRS